MQENLQENNNFETIISSWRRLSGEPAESLTFASMSGDSGSSILKKKEDENLLILDRPKGPIATAASAGVVVVADKPPSGPESNNAPEQNEENLEKSEFITHKDDKEAAGDAQLNDDKEDKNFLENEDKTMKFPESEKSRGDNVDSVYLRPPPPHKVRSNASTTDEEDCGLKCLYYTLQCCDCVIM